MKNMSIAYGMKKKNMAKGGQVKDDVPEPDKKSAEEMQKGAMTPMTFDQGMKNLKDGLGMAKGGEVTMKDHEEDEDGLDMVSRIMKQREEHYSKGGMVSNGGEDKKSHMADGKPNNFDDLSLRDELKFSETGKNSGDEDDDKDIVSRIMKSRSNR